MTSLWKTWRIIAHQNKRRLQLLLQKYICNFPLKILDWSQTTSCNFGTSCTFFSLMMMMMHQKLFSVVRSSRIRKCRARSRELHTLCKIISGQFCNQNSRTFCKQGFPTHHHRIRVVVLRLRSAFIV